MSAQARQARACVCLLFCVYLACSYADRRTDGLSLNWTRWGHYFPRDFGESYAPIMTAFVGSIRAMLDEVMATKATKATRGRRVDQRPLLGMRIPSTPDECLASGLDVLDWVQRGWVDYLIVSEWNSPWPGVSVEPFVRAAEGTPCQVFGMLNDMVRSLCKLRTACRGF